MCVCAAVIVSNTAAAVVTERKPCPSGEESAVRLLLYRCFGVLLFWCFMTQSESVSVSVSEWMGVPNVTLDE